MNIRGEYWWVRLHAQGIDWAQCITGEAGPRQQGQCERLDALPAPIGAHLVLCIPGERARIHMVNLPVSNRKRFLAALHYALEDQLLHDVADYHLVPLPQGRGTTGVPVIVTEHQYLSALIDQCQGAGWKVVLMVPDYLMISAPGASSWYIDASGIPLLLRMPGRDGAVIMGEPGTQVPGMLLLALEQAGITPEKLVVRVCNHDQYKSVAAWSDQLAERHVRLELVMEDQPRSNWLASQPLPDKAINLLTGPYKVVDPRWQDLRRVLPVAAMLGVIVLISIAHWVVQGMNLQKQHTELKQSIDAIYLQAFPETRNLVDARFQMEQQLQRILAENNSSNGGADLLSRLQQIADLLAASPDSLLYSVGFDGSSISVEVSVPDYEALDRLQARFATGASVDIENAELRDGRVFGRIRLGGKA